MCKEHLTVALVCVPCFRYMNDTVLAASVGDASHTAAQLLAGSVPAAEVSMQYGFKGFAQGSLASEVTYRLYVRFPAPMKAGHTYTLLTAGIVDEADNEMRHHRACRAVCGCVGQPLHLC